MTTRTNSIPDMRIGGLCRAAFRRLRRAELLLVALLSTATACGDDDLSAERLRTRPGEELIVDTLRLISYNILEGMKLDPTAGKSELAAWMRKMRPDVVALQEANRFTQSTLEQLAAQWGHPYAVANVKQGDNYPVALTSRYPVEVVSKITEGVSHGAIHARIRGVNVVVLHLWPHAAGANGYADGYAYRLGEIASYLDATVGAYPGEKRWLMTGDFNSVSPLDRDDLPGGAGLNYAVHERILESGYYDLMRACRNYFVPSCPTAAFAGGNDNRIDFIYGSRAMLSDMTLTETVRDAFTDTHSDHYPLLTEFRVYRTEPTDNP